MAATVQQIAEVEKDKDDNSNAVMLSESIVPQSRDELVNTAVKFLKNPKVQSSPVDNKIAFLKKKGLNDLEIDHALQLAGGPNNSILEHKFVPVPQPIPIVISPWGKARDVSMIVILVCGATYGIYQFYRKHIASYFLGEPTENEKVKALEKKVEELQSTVNQLLLNFSYSLKDIHKSIVDNQQKLEELLSTVQSSQGGQKLKDNLQFQEMKSEISSIKGLLLSRHSFPAPPLLQGLPSWQLQGASAEGAERDEKCPLEGTDNDKQSSPENSITTGTSRTWELLNEDSEEADNEVNEVNVSGV